MISVQEPVVRNQTHAHGSEIVTGTIEFDVNSNTFEEFGKFMSELRDFIILKQKESEKV